MGFKRVLLNRLQILDKKTILSDMDDNNNPGANDGNRKHTDFSIDKILSDDRPKICDNNSSSNSVSNHDLNYPITDDFAWNQRLYSTISSAYTSAFLPAPVPPMTSISSKYEIMNLSLRMYEQQVHLSNVDRLRQNSVWSSSTARLYEPLLYNSSSSSSNSYANKYSVFQNFKNYGLNLSLSENLNQVNNLISNTAINNTHANNLIKSELINETNLACSVCNKVFENSLILETHERTHKSPRYKCDECGKGFSQLRNYKYHISVHKGTKEFAAKCPECDKLFNDKGYLSSHLKIHRNKKEYSCPHCPKSFNQRVAFNMHVRM